jgi:nucleoside phosphorylase
MDPHRRLLTHDDYTVACICPMGVELAPVEAMLDEIHQSLPSSRDKNSYTLGRIGAHNVAIAAMPEIGNNNAAIVATQLLNDFTSIRFGLLVGIGGGIPDDDRDDIRLGDVVVNKPTGTFGGVVQFDRGKTHPNGQFERTGTLKKPPMVLMSSVQRLEAQHRLHGNRILEFLSGMLVKFPRMSKEYIHPGIEHDQLFEATYSHKGGETCQLCDQSKVVKRALRGDLEPRIHYGTIGSSNIVIKDGIIRDRLRKDLGILCVEMEAAGLMDEFPCLVVRGICDYADSHKNKNWQPYAAATAAAYAKELLRLIPVNEGVATTRVPTSTTPHHNYITETPPRYLTPISTLATMMAPSPPSHRREFEIAIICALRLEANAVEALFDKFWDDDNHIYGKAFGDPNAYTTGVIGRHNVVLAYMPSMGKVSAASVAANLRSSFEGIRLALVVGICGGVPTGTNDEEILLGDVIISTGLVQYDFGRQLPNMFIMKDTLEDNLGRPNLEIRALLGKLQGYRGQMRLQNSTSDYLVALCQMPGFEKALYPGADVDKLFEPTYRHKHHNLSSCITCTKCEKKEDEVCPAALDTSCSELKCSEDKVVPRGRLVKVKESTDAQKPYIHFGKIASGDTVMKSGEDRDEIATKLDVIAFEMEGAGVWENFPCVVIKGVCDYADIHKNKKWQGYAAAVAAACMKAFLKEWISADKPWQSNQEQQLWQNQFLKSTTQYNHY